MTPRIAHGSRDKAGKWHADDPGDYPPMDVHGTLPWSLLRQDSPTWKARKRHWESLGVHADAPRSHAAGMMRTGRHGTTSAGLSRFDPHLAEVLYSWYCPPAGTVLDPFAGGPARGLVAGHLGHPYTGVDLLAGQVEANRARAQEWQRAGRLSQVPAWVHGDAATQMAAWEQESVDYVLACPPYHNRERYSTDPRDLSAMRWDAFRAAYRQIIADTVQALRPDRFITWVISDVRDHRGHLRGLPYLTVADFLEAGAHLTNDQVLASPLGLAAKRMRPPWTAARTTTRIHQHVMTFVKGDRRAATRAVRREGEA